MYSPSTEDCLDWPIIVICNKPSAVSAARLWQGRDLCCCVIINQNNKCSSSNVSSVAEIMYWGRVYSHGAVTLRFISAITRKSWQYAAIFVELQEKRITLQAINPDLTALCEYTLCSYSSCQLTICDAARNTLIYGNTRHTGICGITYVLGSVVFHSMQGFGVLHNMLGSVLIHAMLGFMVLHTMLGFVVLHGI